MKEEEFTYEEEEAEKTPYLEGVVTAFFAIVFIFFIIKFLFF